MKAIFGLAPIASGTVAWEGQVFKPVSYETVRRGISFVRRAGASSSTFLSKRTSRSAAGPAFRRAQGAHEERPRIIPALKPKLKSKSGTLSGANSRCSPSLAA